jgi:hypothetical protein
VVGECAGSHLLVGRSASVTRWTLRDDGPAPRPTGSRNSLTSRDAVLPAEAVPGATLELISLLSRLVDQRALIPAGPVAARPLGPQANCGHGPPREESCATSIRSS